MKNISYSNIRELFIKLFPVQVFIEFSGALSGFFNGLITGRFLSSVEMVALGLVFPLTRITEAFSSIIAGGVGILVGRYMGRGESEKINSVFTTAVVSTIVFSGIVSLLCFVFTPQMARLFGASTQTLQYTIEYIRGIAFGIVPTMLIPCFFTFLQMSNKSRLTLAFTILLAIFVIAFDLLNVTIFHYGIFGIGFSTSISEYLIMIICIIYFVRNKNIVKFNLSTFSFKECLLLFKLGIPSSLIGVLYSVRNVFINSTCLDIGGIFAGNALSILSSLSGFIDSFNMALGSTVMMLTSVFIGQKDASSLKKTFWCAVLIGEIVAIAKIIFVVLFNKKITIFFGGSLDIVDMTKNLLLWYAISSISNMLQTAIDGTYVSEGKTFLCTSNVVLNAILVPLSCLFIARTIGVNFAWKLYFIADTASIIFYYSTACINKKGLVTNLDDLLYLKQGFETDGVYSITINNIKEVTSISVNLQSFLQEHKIDDRRAKLSGLCVEELTANIIENEFNKDNKENTIDIFASVDNDEITIRLRDNCVPFDPHSKLGMEGKESFEDIGIKMVAKIAKEMNYQITFGMNIVTIKL